MPSLTPRRRAATSRFGLFAIIGVVLIALLASTAGIAEAQRQPQRNDQRPTDLRPTDQRPTDQRPTDQRPTDLRPTDQRPTDRVETLRLACATDIIGDQRGVLCKWSEAKNPNTRGYKLYRIVDGSARQLISTVGLDGRLAYFDTDISAPSTIVYGVISVNRNGRLLGQSEPVRVQIGQDIQKLRLACHPDAIGDQRGILCRWSETTQPTARGYLLYRLVGDGHRELIARVGLDGRRANFDTNVVQGALHIYGVVAVDAHGRVVANSEPSRVQWPAAD